MNKLKSLMCISSLSLVFSTSFAAEEIKRDYPNIYPFRPFEVTHIQDAIKEVSEDSSALINIYDMKNKGLLDHAATKELPWSSTYWPLVNGGIANPYRDEGTLVGDIFRPAKTLSWKKNYRVLTRRQEDLQPKIYSLSEEELAELAPSEKYDLLLGDTNFDLTKKQVNYMERWGSNKKYADIYTLDKVGGKTYKRAMQILNFGTWKYYDGTVMNDKVKHLEMAIKYAVDEMGGLADRYAYEKAKETNFNLFENFLDEGIKIAVQTQNNYVLTNPGKRIATWEGICNGWSTAAGIIPRPKHSFKVELPNGKKLKFYPADVKALVSHLWFNSKIQNTRNEKFNKGGVLSQGLRCNDKSPKKDEWGRYYDSEPDKYANTGIIEPRCVGVHPAIWHSSLVNLIGVQGRSFVVERKIKAAVDNHPLSDYKMEFYNPNTGDYGSLATSKVKIDKEDQFHEYRNKNSKFIVGVRTTMAYMNWIRPARKDYEPASEDYQNRKEVEMLYDLELDAAGNITGGQWRTKEAGKNFLGFGAERTQPDFFWVISKNWKKTDYFDNKNLPAWSDTTKTPPSSWLAEARKSHNTMFYKTHDNGWFEKCQIRNKNKRRDHIKVPCELRENRPLPLTNVINKLIELSK